MTPAVTVADATPAGLPLNPRQAGSEPVTGRPASGRTGYRAWRTTNARISRRTAGPWRVPKRSVPWAAVG